MHVIPFIPEKSGNGKNTKSVRRVVLKIGSRILTDGKGELCPERFPPIAKSVIDALDIDTVIVSSGAVAAGFSTLGHKNAPSKVEERQAAAAVGQTKVMSCWTEVFQKFGRDIAQVLITNDCLTDRRRYVIATQTLSALLERSVIPIVNENDTVSFDDLKVGDNDNLAAMTAALVDADLLIILTDVAGVYPRIPTQDEEIVPIPFAENVSDLFGFCYEKTESESIGGMVTKLQAAEKAASYGIPTIITSGHDPSALKAAMSGENTGTYIAPNSEPMSARRHWMSIQTQPLGAVVIDDGAVAAIRKKASLLPRGITEVRGSFGRGDLISVIDNDGIERARGLVRFDDREIERIRGLHSTEVEGELGELGRGVVIRPDGMVIVDPKE
tara:strand:- start:6245 stop:7399 length:1155 start_codon:yes stop_codon:yes gene_type:complete